MAQTLQVKRTTTSNAPTGLKFGELAFAEGTKRLYVGDNAETGVHLIADIEGTVLKSLFDANTILAANTDNTPAALVVGEQTIVGRLTAGSIAALTATQARTLLNVEDGADVTDATNVNAAGAVMNSDASTADMSFVVDEDNMASNSATKVPTQQSVKAYADTKLPLAGGTLMGALTLSGDPSSALHAATKQYVDARAAGLDPKAAVDCATTANITLSGEQTIDGIATSGSRVLVKNQSTASQNGIYVSAAGAWARATDMDETAEATKGAFTLVAAGTVNGGKMYFISTAPATLGTNDMAWSLLSASPTGAVLATDYNAHTIIYATADDTPLALTVNEDRVVGRKTGGTITGLTGDEILAMMTIISQGTAEAGSDTTRYAWTAQRVRQAILAAPIDGGTY